MPHRIDKTKISDAKTNKAAVTAALARLDQIKTTSGNMTTATLTAAVKDMVTMLKQLIKLVT